MERISSLGQQFADAGVAFSGRHLSDATSDVVAVVAENCVPAAVKLLLYHGSLAADGRNTVQVYVTTHYGRTSLPGTEWMPGETLEAVARRLSRTCLGFELAPHEERFTVLLPASVQYKGTTRGVGPCHTVEIPVAYQVTRQEVADLRLNTQSDGTPASLIERQGHMVRRFDQGEWVELDPDAYPEPLATMLRQFKEGVIDRNTAKLGTHQPEE